MKKLNLDDRVSIEVGIVRCQPLEKIAEIIGRHKSSISREIKSRRIFVAGNYYAGMYQLNVKNGKSHLMFVMDAQTEDTAQKINTSMMLKWLIERLITVVWRLVRAFM